MCLGLSSFTAVALNRHKSAPQEMFVYVQRYFFDLMSHFWLSQVDTGATGMERKEKSRVLLSILLYTGQALTMKNCVAHIVNKESVEKNLLCRVQEFNNRNVSHY